MNVFQRALAEPVRGLGMLCGAQIAFWTIAPAFSHLTPPLDVVEMYAWGREGVVATFKHPNGPGLILEATRRLTGIAGWPAFLMSQIAVAATFWCVFLLGRELMDSKRALAGVLLLTGVYFFSWPTPEFNHNVLQMPLWAAITLLLWRASTHGKLWHWLSLGLLAGFSLWAKYSSALLLVPAAAWILWDADARKKLLTPGPYVALVAFLASAAPQALWLVAHEYQPLHYAAQRSNGGGILGAIEFAVTIVADHLPFVVLLACAGFLGKAAADAPAPPEQRAWRFLLLLGLGPVALLLLGGIFGAGLRTSWGAPMFNLSGLIAIAYLAPRFSEARLKRLAMGASVLLVLVPGLYFAHMKFGAQLTEKPLRGNWPQASITRALEAQWREETGGAPLRIVAGDIWTAGLVGMSSEAPPSVLINGDLSISPWVTPERLHDEGALVIWQAREMPAGIPVDFPTTPLQVLAQGLPINHLIIRYPDAPKAPPLELHYVIRPPQ